MFNKDFTEFKIFLASQSPRRKSLFSQLDIDFSIAPKITVIEDYPKSLQREQIPEYLSKIKAEAYRFLIENNKTIIITADTIVWFNAEVLGKPINIDEAKYFLSCLSGKQHTVITGISLTSLTKQKSFSVSTEVYFDKILPWQIDYYANKYQPLDKAGAYGIQEWIGLIGISKIVGSYNNVVGLPTQKLYVELNSFVS